MDHTKENEEPNRQHNSDRENTYFFKNRIECLTKQVGAIDLGCDVVMELKGDRMFSILTWQQEILCGSKPFCEQNANFRLCSVFQNLGFLEEAKILKKYAVFFTYIVIS